MSDKIKNNEQNFQKRLTLLLEEINDLSKQTGMDLHHFLFSLALSDEVKSHSRSNVNTLKLMESIHQMVSHPSPTGHEASQVVRQILNILLYTRGYEDGCLALKQFQMAVNGKFNVKGVDGMLVQSQKDLLALQKKVDEMNPSDEFNFEIMWEKSSSGLLH